MKAHISFFLFLVLVISLVARSEGQGVLQVSERQTKRCRPRRSGRRSARRSCTNRGPPCVVKPCRRTRSGSFICCGRSRMMPPTPQPTESPAGFCKPGTANIGPCSFTNGNNILVASCMPSSGGPQAFFRVAFMDMNAIQEAIACLNDGRVTITVEQYLGNAPNVCAQSTCEVVDDTCSCVPPSPGCGTVGFANALQACVTAAGL